MCWCVAATCLLSVLTAAPNLLHTSHSPPHHPACRRISLDISTNIFQENSFLPNNKVLATELGLSTILTLWNPFMFWALPILILFVLSFKWCFENEHIFQTYFCPTHTFYFVRKTQVNTNSSRNVWFHFSNTLSLNSIILWSEPKMYVCRMLCWI